MKKKFLFLCLFIALLGFQFSAFADFDDTSKLSISKVNKSTTKNVQEDDPPSPVGMKLTQPNFSLPGLKPTNSMPTAQLQLTSAILTNSDIADSSLAAIADTRTIFYNGANLSAMPRIGENTRISANINGGFVREDGNANNDYDALNANLGIFQQLGDNMSGELGWRYSQFYINEKNKNNQNLQEQGVRLALNRLDLLPHDFFFQTNYELQANFSNPVDRTRISHYFTSGLGYSFTNSFQATVFYRLRHDDFLNRTINDSATRHEFQGQLSYQFNNFINVAGTVSYLFGDTIDLLGNPALTTGAINPSSSNDLGNISFGFRINANVPLLN